MRLPDKPSKLLTLALADLDKCEEDNRYDVASPGYWHYGSYTICRVDLPGAVLAKTLNARPTDTWYPEKVGPDTRGKLWALQYFSKGLIARGFDAMKYCPVGTYMNVQPIYLIRKDYVQKTEILIDTFVKSGD